MNFPHEIRFSTGFKVPGIVGLCVLLKRFAYPCRYLDMIPRFALSVPQLCMVANTAMNFVYNTWGHLLRTFNQPWLSPLNLQHYAKVVHNKGAPLQTCWGFVDGTVRRICRPGTNQTHAHKYQNKILRLRLTS